MRAVGRFTGVVGGFEVLRGAMGVSKKLWGVLKRCEGFMRV